MVYSNMVQIAMISDVVIHVYMNWTTCNAQMERLVFRFVSSIHMYNTVYITHTVTSSFGCEFLTFSNKPDVFYLF